MKIAKMIRQALEQRGLCCLKDASQTIGISTELLRLILHEGHVPKDRTLAVMAERLSIDKSALIMTAHQEKVPVDLKGLFLFPAARRQWPKRRVWPLSEEQCTYLARIMSTEEIQMVRKIRQIPLEEQERIAGYIDYMFASKRETERLFVSEQRRVG